VMCIRGGGSCGCLWGNGVGDHLAEREPSLAFVEHLWQSASRDGHGMGNAAGCAPRGDVVRHSLGSPDPDLISWG
jgi:hypothetical protein